MVGLINGVAVHVGLKVVAPRLLEGLGWEEVDFLGVEAVSMLDHEPVLFPSSFVFRDY